MQEPAIGADVTALMPDVGEDVTDLMGGTVANAAASPTASGEANARRGIVPTPRSGESDTDYAMRVGEETWGTPTLTGLNVVGRVEPAARGVVNLAKRLYTSVLKPKDTTLQRFPNVVDDLLNQRRVISQGSRANVVRGMEQTGAEKRAILSAADQAGRTHPP